MKWGIVVVVEVDSDVTIEVVVEVEVDTDVTTEVVVVATGLVVFIFVVLFGTGVTAEVVVVTVWQGIITIDASALQGTTIVFVTLAAKFYFCF